MTRTVDEPELLAPGEAVDLDNCAREPIHVPGMIQPRGVLLVVREAGRRAAPGVGERGTAPRRPRGGARGPAARRRARRGARA
nr:hypothetical protein [Cellulosimicrobium sp. MM]